MTICYFGAYDPSYPRNSVIRQGLKKSGINAVECQVSPRLSSQLIYKELWKKFNHIKQNEISAIFLAEFNHFVMPFAYYFSKKRKIPLIFDPFISLYDSNVSDRELLSPYSLKAKKYFWMDKISMSLADCLLADTDEHKKYFVSTYNIKKQVFVVPVGADERLFYPRENEEGQGFNVTFWGKFIPLHGIEYILTAAKLLEGHPDIKINLIGDGQIFKKMRCLAEELRLKNVEFQGLVDINELPVLMSKADVCLGIFGNTAKARRVIPNKVYAGIAMKKPVITGDSPGIREFFVHKEHLYLVPMANAQALAEGILSLKNDKDLRRGLAENGYKIFQEKFTSEKIGELVRDVLLQVISNHRIYSYDRHP